MMTSREKLRVAVAGTSFGGNVQIPVFQMHPRTRVVAVSSGHAERAEKTAKENGIPGHYTNFEEMLDKEKPDIVSIVTPPIFHFPMTLAALSRGIHVLCEKPFAMDVGEAQRMKAAADHTPVVAMVDFEFRFLPARAYVTDLIKEGYIGDIRMADFLIHFGRRSDAGDGPFNWWSEESKGGGLLGAFGSHTVDTLQLQLGPPRRLLCELATFVAEREGQRVTSDDSYSLDDARYGVYGSQGQLIVTSIEGTELRGGRRADGKSRILEIPPKYHLEPETAMLRAPFRALLNRFVYAIDNHMPSPSPNFEDGLNSQIMLDAARTSSKSKIWIDFE
jgi:predicted dehydrogenase